MSSKQASVPVCCTLERHLFLGFVKMSTEGEDVKGTEEATTEEQQVRVSHNINVKVLASELTS